MPEDSKLVGGNNPNKNYQDANSENKIENRSLGHEVREDNDSFTNVTLQTISLSQFRDMYRQQDFPVFTNPAVHHIVPRINANLPSPAIASQDKKEKVENFNYFRTNLMG